MNRTLKREMPYEHRGYYGTVMKADRLDLMGSPVKLLRPNHIGDNLFAADIAECIGFWSINIYPDMIQDGNGWPGFGAIKFEVTINGI